MEVNKRYPAFMKPFLSGCLQRMQIPPSFTSFMKGVVPNKAFLKNCHGKFSAVEVSKVGDDFYFQEGWRKFVRENEIDFGHLLVFQYIDDSKFNLKILGKISSEDEILGAFEFNTNELITLEDNAVEEDKEEEEMLNKRITRKRKNETSSNDDMELDYTNNNNNDSPSKTGYMNGNHYFVSKVGEKRTNCWNVPSEIINDNEIKLGEVINIRDPHGYTWSVKVAPWNDGRIWLKGWTQIYRRNHMRGGDEFICELVQGNGSTETYIQLHINN